MSALVRKFTAGDLLTRLRRVYLALVAVVCLTTGLQLEFGRGGRVELRVLAGVGVIVLLAVLVRAHRRGGFHPATIAIDAVLFILVGLALGDATRALGLIYPVLFVRSSYGSARGLLVTLAGYVSSLAVGYAISGGALEVVWPTFLGQLPIMITEASVGHLLARALTRQASLESELRQSESRFRSLVQNSSDVIMVVSPTGEIRFHTPSVERLLGYAPDALVGARLEDYLHPDDRAAALSCVADTAAGGDCTGGEWRILHRDGMWLHVDVLSSGMLNDPTIRGLVLTMRNVTERKALERRLTHEALHDPLTDLPNRALLQRRLAGALARTDSTGLAVLFVDLDDFKVVNDTLGHAAGDQLIIAVGRRLRDALREEDLAARLGGDEFAVLVENVTSPAEAEAVAARLTTELQRPFTIAGRQVFAHASIGVAVGIPGEVTPDELLRKADVAMYGAKGHGKARFETYDPVQNASVERRAWAETDLARAFGAGELFLEYQPVVGLEDGGIVGAEALVRWRHPQRGIIPPLDFIPAAEQSGLIVPIGQWILLEACRQARVWQDSAPADQQCSISVNVSAKQLLHPDLVAHIQVALAESGIDPRTLAVEVTETVLQHDAAAVARRLDEIKALGVRIALDDFGSGYTSLGYLRRFPVDLLKIDRSFIKGIGENELDRALASAMLGLGKSLRVRTVAEGIETPAQAALLHAMGCELAQGYYFGKPMSGNAITAMVAGRLVPLAVTA